jgi:putative hydrolases of HD superfamily
MAALETLLEGLSLKSLSRAGWVRKGVSGPESVAAHSWGICWLALALAPPELDLGKLLAYAALHDLPEVRVGDLTPADRVSKSEKARREHDAMAALARERPQLLAMFEAYEAQADAEARFVRELDRLDMALQALAYHQRGAAGMLEFVDSAAEVVRHPALRPSLDEVRARMISVSSS